MLTWGSLSDFVMMAMLCAIIAFVLTLERTYDQLLVLDTMLTFRHRN